MAPVTLNAETALFGRADPERIETIRERLTELCAGNVQGASANIEVTERLHEYAISRAIFARRHEFPSFVLTSISGVSYRYCLPLVLIIDGRPVIAYLDPRRNGGLTVEGRRVLFSIMHHRARTLDEDLGQADLAVFSFPMIIGAGGVAERGIRAHFAGELELYTYDMLERLVAETYEQWIKVLSEREEDIRRAAGDDGPLFR